MKLFGEYLVEKNIISAEHLVKALIRQTSTLPSLAEIAFENSFITAEEILKIFKVQFEKKTGFIEAARELNIWSEQTHEEAEKHINAVRIPLGQILVEMSVVPLEAITHALDDFLGEMNTTPEPKPAPEPAPIPTLDSEATAALISDAVLISAAESDFFPDTTQASASKTTSATDYSNYYEILNADHQEALDSSFGLMKIGDISLSPIKAVKDVLHLFKGAARFAGLKNSESLIQLMETLMDHIMKAEVGKVNGDLIIKVGLACQKGTDLLWEISAKLKEGSSEDIIMQNEDFKKSFESASAILEMLNFDLDLL